MHLPGVFFANVKPLDLTLKTANVKTSRKNGHVVMFAVEIWKCLCTMCQEICSCVIIRTDL